MWDRLMQQFKSVKILPVALASSFSVESEMTKIVFCSVKACWNRNVSIKNKLPVNNGSSTYKFVFYQITANTICTREMVDIINKPIPTMYAEYVYKEKG